MATILENDNTSGAINNVVDASAEIKISDNGKVITLNRAAGVAVQLPAAKGTGAAYHFVVGTTVTSNSITITTGSGDAYQGSAIQQGASNAVKVYSPTAGNNQITLDGTTKGGKVGDIIDVVDIADGVYLVEVVEQASGTVASPFGTAA